MEANRVEFTGTISRLAKVATKTGTPMARFILECGRDSFKAVAFGNIAMEILRLSDGDEIGVMGTGSINSWKDGEGRWRNDFQVSCWEAEIHGHVVRYQRDGQPVSRSSRAGHAAPQRKTIGTEGGQYDYQGGPF